MGLSELVLKVPASEAMAARPPTATTTTTATAARPVRKRSLKTTSKKTHSRESSGASNLSVKFSVNDETVSTSSTSRLHNRRRSSEEADEDLTLSDRLSHEEDLEEEDDDDGFHQASKSCESIPQDRLSPDSEVDDHRMLPGDAKSQNSDYGSFCHTPSDTFGVHHLASNASDQDPPEMASPDPGLDVSADTQRQPLLDINDSSSDDDAGANSSGYMRRKARLHNRQQQQQALQGPPSVSGSERTEVDTSDLTDRIKGEPIKTLLAGIFLVFAWIATTTSLALTHERVPDYKPLPDLFLDNIKYQPWGLDASEIVIMLSTLLAFLVSLFHKHRCIVLRRIFLLVGIHYYYRAITMYVTVLPKPNEHYMCEPKSNDTTAYDIFMRVFKLLSGFGLSINGKHVYCGDYIYSGHTMTLIMGYLVIKEYSPRRWYLFHWLSLIMTIFGILALLLARGHYSIDVVVAYWITTRLWWLYHTMANHQVLKDSDNEDNYLQKVWWWYIFTYFEGQVPVKLPRQYGWPLPEKLLQWNVFRRRNLLQSEDDLEAGLRPPSGTPAQ